MKTTHTLVQRFAAVITCLLLSSCGGGGDNLAPPPAALQFFKDMRAQALAAAPANSNAAASAVSAANTAVTADMVLDWAEFKFADLFPKAIAQKFPAVVYQGTTYNARAYSGAWGTRYLGITPDGRIFGLGDFTNNALQAFDTVAFWRTQVAADACSVYVGTCMPVSPLAGRAWTAFSQIGSGLQATAYPLVGIADDGRAVVVQKPPSVLGVAMPSVTLGRPGGTGSPTWTPPVSAATFGTRSGQPVPTNLEIQSLKVASNGRAAVLAVGRGGGCSTANVADQCVFVSVLDADHTGWSPFDVVARTLDLPIASSGELSINSRGDVAIYFSFDIAGSPKSVYWRTASEMSFKLFNVARTELISRLTLDDSGGMVVAGDLAQNGTQDIVVWRGSVESGFGQPVVVDRRAAPATLRWLWTSPGGSSFLMWKQNNGLADVMFGARFNRTSPAILVEDLGLADTLVIDALNQGFKTAGFLDDDSLNFVRSSYLDLSCSTTRWATTGALQLAVAAAPCTLDSFGGSVIWAVDPIGNVLSVIGRDFRWSTFDTNLNRQIDGPVNTATVRIGPGYILGVPAPNTVRAASMALSRSGIGVMVLTANLDEMPTPSSPNGDGRPSVANSWAAYFK